MTNIVLNVVNEKCPFCQKGDVFQKSAILELAKMNSHCPVCKRDFTGEPGYYFGAMYVSYGIAVGVALLVFLFCRFVIGTDSVFWTLGSCVSAIVLISFRNYRWSRIIWLKLFPPGENTNFESGQRELKWGGLKSGVCSNEGGCDGCWLKMETKKPLIIMGFFMGGRAGTIIESVSEELEQINSLKM